ncbi:uncharacterized protein ACRADG_002451 [Cochliomyia hominivorax]
MGKINKNNLKAKLLGNKSPKQKQAAKGTKTDVNSIHKDKILLHKSITPKKITTKREKYRQKRKNLLNKFSLIKKQQKVERARRNREKTAVIGDLKPLKDALPSLEDILKLSKDKDQLKTGVKEFDEISEEKSLNLKQKIKKKKEKFIKQVKSFQAILKDPEFKKNPREAIRYHIQYTHGLVDQ